MLVRRRKCYPRTLAAITLILSILTNSWSNVGNVHNAKEPLASASEKRSGRADMPHLNPKEKLRIPEADTDHPRDDAIVSKNIAKPQLSFEANQGQADPSVKFMSHRGGYGLFLLQQELVLAFYEKQQLTRGKQQARAHAGDKTSVSSLRIKLKNSNPTPRVTGLDELPGKSNYFLGNNPENWQTNVPNYARVKYEQVYPGIDMVYYGNQQDLEYDFVVSPGSDPRSIRLSFAGARKVRLDRRGDLILSFNKREIKQHKPFVYQQIDGGQKEIASSYVMFGKREVGISVGEYDKQKPLVIDPVLSYSTYLWGMAHGVSVDSARNIYVTGEGWPNLPLVNQAQGYAGGLDLYVQKLDPTGSTLLYSTFIGGSGSEAGVADLAIDEFGNAYVAGATTSADFPTVNPVQAVYGGGIDGFAIKLGATGNQLLYSTYLGGSSEDGAESVAIDAAGNAYITGTTHSTNYPTFNPLQTDNGEADGFVTALNVTGNAFIYSTYLGGPGWDQCFGIAVDPAGNAYVTGNGPDSFPTTPGAYDNNGGAFITKINPDGSALIYSAQLGGNTSGRDIGIDTEGSAYVTGNTSGGLPTTPGAFQPNFGGSNGDSFVTKLDPLGASLVYSSYLGGGGSDSSGGIAVDSEGGAYLTGSTMGGFPLVNATQTLMGGGGGFPDAFVAKVSASGGSLIFSTYLGGPGQDEGLTIAVDSDGNAYIAGKTNGTADFPQVNPILTSGPGGFLTKITGLKTYNITGHITDVSGAGLSAVTVTLTGSQSRTTQTDANGDYALLNLPSQGNYTVRPTKAGFSFAPTTQTFNNLSANQTADFSTLFYTISGRVTDSQGAGLAGATLTLSGTQTAIKQTDANGNYSFPNCAAGGNFVITPSYTSFTLTYAFAPATRSFSNLSANQTAADFTYTTTTRVALNSLADAYVQDGASANTNFGSVPTLLVKSANQADQRRDTYLKFDLSPLNRTIVNAKLRFYAGLSVAGSAAISAYPVMDTLWSETAITWANKPAYVNTALSTVSVTSTTFAFYDLDVTSHVLTEKTAGRNIVSLALHSPSNSTPHILLNSREAATNKPQLLVTTSDTNNAAPSVSLTSPTGGASYTKPATVALSASASDSDGSISKVDYYSGTNLVGTATTSPYNATWPGVGVGNYTITAVATDNQGLTAVSSPVQVTVNNGNVPPAVEITGPSNNTNVAVGSNVTVSATASDVDDNVTQVEFFRGSTSLGIDMNAPYMVNWNNAAAGAYVLTARATDNAGAITTSAPVNVNVVWQTGFSAMADTYVRDGSTAATNFGSSLELQVQQGASGSNRESHLRFDLTAVTGIAQAKLRIFGRLSDTSGTNVGVTVYPVANTSWGETTVTWNTKPATGTAVMTTTVTDNVDRWYEFDVTSYIKAERDNAEHALVSLALKSQSASNPFVIFNSREASTNRPQLVIWTTQARNALFAVGSSNLNAADAAVKSRLESLGFTVTAKVANNNLITADANGKALVMISSTCTATSVGTKFKHVAIPVVSWEFDVLDDFGMTGTLSTDFGTSATTQNLSITNATHALAAGLPSGTTTVVTSASAFSWGIPNVNAAKIAMLVGDATKSVIFGYESGVQMPGLHAPSRRVALFMTDLTANSFNSNGGALFDAAVKWATEIITTPVISQLTPNSGPAGTTVTITGINFTPTQGTSTVSFNGVPTSPSSWSEKTIVVAVPLYVTTSVVVVTVNGVASNGVTFTVGEIDSDSDGLADAWEIQYFGNLAQTAGGDPDGDGMSNLQEYQQGRNPTLNALFDDAGINLKVFTPLVPDP